VRRGYRSGTKIVSLKVGVPRWEVLNSLSTCCAFYSTFSLSTSLLLKRMKWRQKPIPTFSVCRESASSSSLNLPRGPLPLSPPHPPPLASSAALPHPPLAPPHPTCCAAVASLRPPLATPNQAASPHISCLPHLLLRPLSAPPIQAAPPSIQAAPPPSPSSLASSSGRRPRRRSRPGRRHLLPPSPPDLGL
jgi:hypothetical protein